MDWKIYTNIPLGYLISAKTPTVKPWHPCTVTAIVTLNADGTVWSATLYTRETNTNDSTLQQEILRISRKAIFSPLAGGEQRQGTIRFIYR